MVNDYKDYLEHHGILGQKWGVRRFQNEDGSLTSAGRQRYRKGDVKKDIRTVIDSFGNSDYKDFTFKNIKHFAVEYDDGKPVAFAYDRTYKVDNKFGVMLSVGTNINYRGRGLAKKLASKVINEAEQDDNIVEIVWGIADKSNIGSINTAKSLGFEHWYDYDGNTFYIKPKR